jgi:hypothetical protein
MQLAQAMKEMYVSLVRHIRLTYIVFIPYADWTAAVLWTALHEL